MKKIFAVPAFILLQSLAHAQQPAAPDVLYGDLFVQVQMQHVFPDGKTFVDCVPKRPVGDIMYDYGLAKPTGQQLKDFVARNFTVHTPPKVTAESIEKKPIAEHIKDLWLVLRRDADTKQPGSSLLPLPGQYIVPGGRFREIYYWDSYFTMLGLKESGEIQTIENMISNFAYLIDEYGHIPNGNRSYYLSRSQPPFFSMMVELLAGIKGTGVYKKYLPQLKKEYDYWTDKTAATKHNATMPDGSILSRYWDRDDFPRQESYAQDVEVIDNYFMTAKLTMEARKEMEKTIGRNLRSGAESGWDFSTRWFADGQNITSIQTTDIVPVDLNCLLYHLEKTIALAAALEKDVTTQKMMLRAANGRRASILKYCWNPQKQIYCDYNLATKQTGKIITAAGMFPLFVRIAPKAQGKMAAATAGLELSKPGGFGTTNNHSGQQWDAPNGWAPLQWVAVKGLMNYGERKMARTIAGNWTALNEKVYLSTGRLMEKYNVEDLTKEAGGGEYPGQDGFGWTNGVYLALKAMFK